MSSQPGSHSSIFRELSSRFGYPKSEILPRILERLVNPEESEILLTLPNTPEQVGEKVGIPLVKVNKILEGLFRRGLVLPALTENGKQGYALCGNLVDLTLFEIGARKARGERLTPNDLEVIDLWKEFVENSIHERPSTEYEEPMARVVPVNRTIPLDFEVLPFERVAEIVKNARVIAVAQCACRTRERRCNNPLETCLLLDDAATITIKQGVAKKKPVGETLRILEQCEDLGLVHSTNNASEGIQFICNCCPCCCIFLRGLIHFGRKDSIARSRYRAVVNEDLCTGCGICEDRCVFRAMKIKDEVAYSDPEKCFGCGLCASKCPTQAIRLVPVKEREHIPAKPKDLLPALAAQKIQHSFSH